MKVRTDYRDGHYSAEEYTESHAKAGLAYVEISAEEWVRYKQELAINAKRHRFLQKLDNQQFALDHPEDAHLA